VTAPTWLTGGFVAMMLGVAGFCGGRLVLARRTRRPAELDSDTVHVLMGVAMAGMLAAVLRFGSSRVWIGLFAAGAAWFAWQALRVRRGAPASSWRCAQPVPHLLECGVMLYMLTALPSARPSAAMGASASRLALLSLVLAMSMIGYVVWLADRFTVTAGTASCARVLAPRCAASCKIAMGITMAYMLVLML
jgi:hypothetical protein